MANFPRRLGCGSSGKTACCGICCIVDFVQIVSQYISEYTKKQSADISHDHWFNFWEKASYCRWMRRHIVVPENVQREAKLNSFGVEKMLCESWPSLTSLWVQLLTKCTLHRSKSWTRGTSQFHTKSEESAESIQSSQHPYPFQHTSHFSL